MSFPNLYYKRTAATAKACYICYKPTTTVLATIDTTDFLYACTVHLSDCGFATRAPEPETDANKLGASLEAIAKVKEEWEEKQKRRKEKEKEKEKKDDEKEKKDDEKEAKGDKDKSNEADEGKRVEGKHDPDQKSDATKVSGSWSSGQSTPASKPTHERYVLHRDIFALRVADHRRRRQTAQAKALAPRLPGAPHTTIR